MMNGRIKEAVVLAAGNGRRMSARSSLPKPLIPVAGRPLLERVVSRLVEVRVEKVFIVVGYRAEEIRGRLSLDSASIEVEWVENPRYHLANGISLLAVEEKVRSPFLLLMSDHLFESSTLETIMEFPVPERGGILATDSKIDRVFDLPDATKVVSEGDCVRRMGKDLTDFNTIDTGVFALSESVFPAMRESSENGDCSLTGGISKLSCDCSMRTWDIGDRRWIDIDTPEALEEAERLVKAGYFS